MAECLICGKETVNENQICDECAQIEKNEDKEAMPENKEVELAPSKKMGILSMIFGIVSISLFFFGGTISSILGFIPYLGRLLSGLLDTSSFLIQLGGAIVAVVLGAKSKNTMGQKMGKAGKVLGIIMLVLIPVNIIVSFVIGIIIGVVTSILFIMASILGFLPTILGIVAEILSAMPFLLESLEGIDWASLLEIIEQIDPSIAELLKEYFPQLFGYLPRLLDVAKNFIC